MPNPAAAQQAGKLSTILETNANHKLLQSFI